MDDERFRQHARDAIEEHSRRPIDEAVWNALAPKFRYIMGSFEDPEAMKRLGEVLEEADRSMAATAAGCSTWRCLPTCSR
jgi:glucose-6-phosphate 1-dehydrogenase